jgi:signal transduction histidine kinase
VDEWPADRSADRSAQRAPASGALAGDDFRARWEQRWQRRERRRPLLFLPVLILIIQLVGSNVAERGQPQAQALDSLAYLLLIVGPLALTVRRPLPLTSYVVSLAATLVYLLQGYPRGPFFAAALVALFNATRRANRPAVWTVTALAYTLFVALAGRPLSEDIAIAAWTAAALAVAELNRVRGNTMAQVRRAQQEAARARAEQSRRQASDERLRIARELHDVLGHHLSLINVRAGVALHLLDSQRDGQPEGPGGNEHGELGEAREALSAIKLASAEALREVRGVLATLQVRDESAPRTPAPSLADVDGLVEQARAAGLAVSVRRVGTPAEISNAEVPNAEVSNAEVPNEVGRAAYRIVQEALTNVRRHAGSAAEVTVVIRYEPAALDIQVDDTGIGPQSSTSDGNGIPGMRERAAALGGTLTAAAGAGGGFRVHAVLPLQPRKPGGEKEAR